jgi:hypothetical protein
VGCLQFKNLKLCVQPVSDIIFSQPFNGMGGVLITNKFQCHYMILLNTSNNSVCINYLYPLINRYRIIYRCDFY